MRATLFRSTMPSTSTRAVRIAIAVLLAVSFIGTAFYLTSSRSLFSPVTAQSTEELLKEYAALDTDGDGLPDWQEALYGTDPQNPESVQEGMRDADAVAQGLVSPRFLSEAAVEADIEDSEIPGAKTDPNSLTARFARQFFSSYVTTRGEVPPTGEEIQRFVEEATADLFANDPAFITVGDVKQGTGSVSTYITSLDSALVSANAAGQESELTYFDALVKGDASKRADLVRISGAYARAAEAFKNVSAPPGLAAAHSELINASHGLSVATESMATYENDPLRGFVGMSGYNIHSEKLVAALKLIRQEAVRQGVALEGGLFGSLLIGIDSSL